MRAESAGGSSVDTFTSRNLVILALVQVGTLVASVLGAGAAYKWYTKLPSPPPVPLPCRLLADFGWLGLVLPVVWLALTLWVFSRSRESGRDRWAAVAAGFLLLALFLLLGWFGAFSPWAQLATRYLNTL